MIVQVQRDGKIHEIEFGRGKTISALKVVGQTENTGTRVWFKPDAEVFEELEFSFETLKQRLRELAYFTIYHSHHHLETIRKMTGG